MVSAVTDLREKNMNHMDKISELTRQIVELNEALNYQKMEGLSPTSANHVDNIREEFEQMLIKTKARYLSELEDEREQRQIVERKFETLKREKRVAAFPVTREIQTNLEWVVLFPYSDLFSLINC